MKSNQKIAHLFVAGLAATIINENACAGGAQIGPVYVEQVAIIAVTAIGHIAGNMELKIKGGFVVPSGVSCDGTYITTLKTVDVGSKMFALMTAAQLAQRPVYLYITDDPNYSAFGGRCSLLGVSIAP